MRLTLEINLNTCLPPTLVWECLRLGRTKETFVTSKKSKRMRFESKFASYVIQYGTDLRKFRFSGSGFFFICSPKGHFKISVNGKDVNYSALQNHAKSPIARVIGFSGDRNGKTISVSFADTETKNVLGTDEITVNFVAKEDGEY